MKPFRLFGWLLVPPICKDEAGRALPHEHIWRRLTGASDFNNPSSRHYGTFNGDQEECRVCGMVRYVNEDGSPRGVPFNKAC